MNDQEFLKWIWYRLTEVHGESRNVDYMRKLWAVMEATDHKQETRNVGLYPWERQS